jgi:hypothetical protein
MPQELDNSLAFLPAALAASEGCRPFVRIVRSRDELDRGLRDLAPGLKWLQVEGLLGDSDAWALAAQGTSDVPLDVMLAVPGSEFANLYRLVEVRSVREVRVSLPASPGFLKAVRLAASLGFPIRLLPGQPSAETIKELAETVDFYLHDPRVEAPVEFFHSLLASMRGVETGSLWLIVEEDPAIFRHYDADGHTRLPRAAQAAREGICPSEFVQTHLARLVAGGAECATCRWQQACRGYFKWPDPGYSCHGVKQLFSMIEAAADEIGQDLAGREGQPCLTGGNKP